MFCRHLARILNQQLTDRCACHAGLIPATILVETDQVLIHLEEHWQSILGWLVKSERLNQPPNLGVRWLKDTALEKRSRSLDSQHKVPVSGNC